MPNAKGHLIRCGFKKAATYGTPVAVGAGDGIYLLREAIKGSIPGIDDTSAGGARQLRGVDVSGQRYGGTIQLPARYEGAWLRLLAMAMGTAGTPTGSNPYVHTFKIPNDPSGLFGTLVLDKQVGANPAWEYDSVHVNKVTLRGEAGTGEAARLAVEFELICRALARASGINGATQVGNLTFPAAGHLLFHNLTIRMNTASGGGLASPANDLKVKRFELVLDNHYKPDFFYSGSAYIDQPDIEGFADVTGSFLLEKYSADSPGVTEFLANTMMKADLVWTTGASAIFKLELPNLRLIDGAGDREMASLGLIPGGFPFKLYKPAAAPTGMTATDYFWAFITNTFATDYLA